MGLIVERWTGFWERKFINRNTVLNKTGEKGIHLETLDLELARLLFNGKEESAVDMNVAIFVDIRMKN